MFPREQVHKEIAYYQTHQNTYGLPLDNRKSYTKLDWIVWTATLADSDADFRAFLMPLVKWAAETPDRVPLADWFETTDGRHYHFRARSVVGGVCQSADGCRPLAEVVAEGRAFVNCSQ